MSSSPFKPFLLAAMVASISGCGTLFGEEGYFRDRGDDYLDAAEVKPMKLPANTNQQAVEELYAIPPIAIAKPDDDELTLVEGYVVPRPQPLGASAFGEHVKIQKLAEKRWILAGLPPSEIWPKVRHFLNDNGLRVVYTDAINGVIETGWLQFKEAKDTKDRYRLQMEQGVQPDSTEVHVLHLSVPSEVGGEGQVNWPKRSINKEREAWLLDELAAYLASQGDDSGATSLLAQTIGGDAKIDIVDVEREPVMKMALSLTRAWATLGYAVSQQGMVRYDENANSGVYYVDQGNGNTEDEPGFFSGLFSFGDDESESETGTKAVTNNAKSPFSLNQILSSMPVSDPDVRNLFPNLDVAEDAEELEDVPGYLVVITGSDNDLQVRVRNAYGKRLPSADAKRLLKLIRRNLI